MCFCEQVAEQAKEIKNVDLVIAEIRVKGQARIHTSTWTVRALSN